MKSRLALLFCLLINVATVHRALAQNPAPHAHSGGYLGIGVAEIDDERAKALNLKEDHGVVVMNVDPGTPAARAGLKESDVILEYNGQRVEGADEFIRLVRETPANRKITLRISRNGSSQTVTATLAAKPAMSSITGNFPGIPPIPSMPDLPRFILPDTPRPSLGWENRSVGIELTNLNSQLAEYFGVKQGALVVWVAKNSPAEKAGVKAGDVVVRVNGGAVTSPREVSSRFKDHLNDLPIPVAVVRNHREMNFAVRPADGWQTSDAEDR